ncbi:hypothetical protein VTI28DRAFT_7162 [Corynascus sepedonium]
MISANAEEPYIPTLVMDVPGDLYSPFWDLQADTSPSLRTLGITPSSRDQRDGTPGGIGACHGARGLHSPKNLAATFRDGEEQAQRFSRVVHSLDEARPRGVTVVTQDSRAEPNSPSPTHALASLAD